MNKVVITLIMMCVLCAAETVAQGSRIMLTQLERGQVQPADDSLRSGQIGLTNTNGNQRYAPYVEIQVDSVNFIPTPTGNTTNLSEFVYDTTGRLWYIDWQGRAVEFAAGSSSCDVDWLQISDNSCPDAITDSIYHQKYASVGARLVWPGAEFLVNDSTTAGILVVQGSRNARTAWYDSNVGTFSMFDHGGSTPVFYMPVGANMVFKTTAGTPQTPVGSQVDHFGINTQDSTIQMFRYPRTRADTQSVVNFLYTDPVGKVRSRPVTYIQDSLGLGENIYNTNGQTPDNDTRSVIVGGNGASDNGYLTFDYSNSYQTAIAITGGDGAGNTGSVRINSPTQVPAILIENDNGRFGDITGTVDGGGLQYQPGTVRVGDPFDIDISGLTVNFPLNTTKISESVENYVQVSSDGTGITGGWSDASKIDIRNQTGNNFIYQDAERLNIGGSNTGGSQGTYDLLADTSGDFRLLAQRNGSDQQATVTLNNSTSGVVAVTLKAYNVSAATPENKMGVDTMGAFIVSGSGTPSAGDVLTLGSDLLHATFQPAGGGACPTCFVDGGNSFGATATLGTNDANALNIEIADSVRATMSTTGVLTVTDYSPVTNNIVQKLAIGTTPPAGQADTGLGPYMSMYSTDYNDNGIEIARIAARISNSDPDFYDGFLDFWTNGNGPGTMTSKMTISNSGNVGIGTTDPLYLLTNSAATITDGTSLTSTGGFGWVVSASGNSYAAAISRTATSSTAHGFLVEANASTNATRAFTVSAGSTPTRVFTVNCDQTVGILDETPETTLDVTGTIGTNHLIGQNLTPTIAVNTAGAGTGATASMTNAQSSDLAGRFSITSGTGATTGLWATITFDDAFTLAPVVQFDCEDADCAGLRWYSNTSTTSTELFIASGGADGTVYEFNFIIIGGK